MLVIKVDNSSVSCPSTTCNVTDCPSSYTCACSWSLTQGDVNSSNYYCVSSYSQSITGGTGDDSDEGLYGLLALLIIPIACLGALAFMKYVVCSRLWQSHAWLQGTNRGPCRCWGAGEGLRTEKKQEMQLMSGLCLQVNRLQKLPLAPTRQGPL